MTVPIASEVQPAQVLAKPRKGVWRRLLQRKLARQQRVRDTLEKAFPFPADWAAALDDDVVLCRCEEITVGALRATAQIDGTRELNRGKALTRVGMGRCQGRMCGAAAAEVLARASGVALPQVGWLRAQPPIKPIPVQLFSIDVQTAAGPPGAAPAFSLEQPLSAAGRR